jgi:hypothetical protein
VQDDLAQTLERIGGELPGPAWVTWTVPVVNEKTRICCGWKRWSGSCLLDREEGWTHEDRSPSAGTRGFRVLARFDDRRVTSIRGHSTDCVLDAGDVPLIEIEGVDPEQSVSWLADRVRGRRDGFDLGNGALAALALHATPAADRALARLAAPESPADQRERATFWLGSARGDAGFRILSRMLAEDPDPGVREQVIFALHVSDAPESLDLLIATARGADSEDLRSRALFWLGQEAGDRATAVLRQSVEDDPEAEVREQAVFALSQLPAERGIPLLVELARSSRHPEVRRGALFWLGQSDDPRALDLFVEILER